MLDSKLAFAKHVAQGKTDQTHDDLEHQQQQHLNEMVLGLMKQQRAMLDNISAHLQMPGKANTNLLQETGLQELLIKERLLSPSDAVAKRKEIYQEYLQPSLVANSVSVLTPTDTTVTVGVDDGET